jgi:hypothetical protein
MLILFNLVIDTDIDFLKFSNQVHF